MKIIKFLICGILVITNIPSFATDLAQIYREALITDPLFQQAFASYKSTSEAVPQAWSTLLPQIGALADAGVTRTNQITPPPVTVVGPMSTFHYWNYTLAASQSIFNYQAWMQVQQAKATVKQAQAIFNFSAQDLINRVATSYFKVLEAKDKLRFTQAEKRANKRQLDQASQRYKVGLDTLTSVYEAQAAYDAASAKEIADQNNVLNRYEDLRRLTNRTYTNLAPLNAKRLPLIKPLPTNVRQWIATSLRQNYNFIAAKYALESARQNIRVKASGNFPTLALQASYQEANSDLSDSSGNSLPNAKQELVQLSLNFPAYQGGLVLSQTRQAQDDFENTSQKLEQTYRETVVNTTVAYNNVVSGLSKIKADREAVLSAANSASSTEAQFDAGTRTMVDVLDEQQKLYQAQTQLATDQYTYILSIIALKQAAGTLSAQDIFVINSWLNGTEQKVVQSKTKNIVANKSRSITSMTKPQAKKIPHSKIPKIGVPS